MASRTSLVAALAGAVASLGATYQTANFEADPGTTEKLLYNAQYLLYRALRDKAPATR